jgi:hypothetical protein
MAARNSTRGVAAIRCNLAERETSEVRRTVLHINAGDRKTIAPQAFSYSFTIAEAHHCSKFG